MSLKLFRSTGFHSILSPGETRVALHPGWAVLGVSAWIGVACNVWFWQALIRGGDFLGPLVLALAVTACAATALSLLGWRRTFKPIATLCLLMAALVASGAWTQNVTLQAALEGRRLGALMPTWASLFGWQVPLLLVLLGLIPVLWLWNTQLRRLSGSAQWRSNTGSLFFYAPLAVAALWLLQRLPAA